MYFDEQMFKIISKHLNMSKAESDMFLELHRSSLLEVIFMKILNFYAAKNSQKEIDEIEKYMSASANENSVEAQVKILQIVEETIQNYPALWDEIKETMVRIHTDMFMKFMEVGGSDGQIDILTYMLKKKKQIKQVGEKFREYKRKSKLLTQPKATEPLNSPK